MKQLLANQRQPAPQTDTATQLSSNVTSTLLDRPHDEVYKMYETDVKIDMAARQLSQQYTTEQELGKKEELLGQLQLIVKDQFQVRQKIRELELQQLKQRLAEVQAQLARRQELADAIIERRVNQLTGQADELD